MVMARLNKGKFWVDFWVHVLDVPFEWYMLGEVDISVSSFHLCVFVDVTKPLHHVLFVEWEGEER